MSEPGSYPPYVPSAFSHNTSFQNPRSDEVASLGTIQRRHDEIRIPDMEILPPTYRPRDITAVQKNAKDVSGSHE